MTIQISEFRNICMMILATSLVACMPEKGDEEKIGTMPPISSIRSGQEWYDTDSKLIQAHGGGLMYNDGLYYWYGENKDTTTAYPRLRTEVIGISCYSSKNLVNWENHGVVLPAVKDDPEHSMYPTRVAERPKVIFNDQTGKYVMWLHIDDSLYQKAHVAVAVSDKATGPFTFLDDFRPLGFQSRDMTVFKDDDGKAYLIYGSGWHDKVVIAEMSDDYLTLTGEYTTHLHTSGPPDGREAPAMFKRMGKYYLITSGTTGWFTNPARYDMAENINGPYLDMGNPCVGIYAEQTFIGQSTFVLPAQGMENAYVFMADRWIPTDLKNSRYIWLPIHFDEEGRIIIRWISEWNLDFFNNPQ